MNTTEKPTHIASTFYFLPKHNANAEKNKKSLQSSTQENFFPTLLFLIKIFSPTHGFTASTTNCASNTNRFGQSIYKLHTIHHWTDKRASANSTYKKLAVQWLNEALRFISSFRLFENEVMQNLHPQVAAKPYASPYEDKPVYFGYI
jgi:hypothetical protein